MKVNFHKTFRPTYLTFKNRKMSFVDLATSSVHRRHELENRIHILQEKCDQAINNINNMKMKASSFVGHLNCEPSELKERYLSVVQKLEEFMYLISDFNLAMSETAYTNSTPTPLQNTSLVATLEPEPSSSISCPQPEPSSIPAPEENSGPSLETEVVVRQDKEVQCEDNAEEIFVEPVKPKEKELVAKIAKLTVSDLLKPKAMESPLLESGVNEFCICAPQPVLEIDHEYPATIMSVEGCHFSVITSEISEVLAYMKEMTEHYKASQTCLSEAEMADITYCAYREEDPTVYYRALVLEKPKEGDETVSLYVVDTGEIRSAPRHALRRLHTKYCSRPPYARFCHLAGLDLDNFTVNSLEDFVDAFSDRKCNILVDDNSSESIGVYVLLPCGAVLNDLIIEHNATTPNERVLKKEDSPTPDIDDNSEDKMPSHRDTVPVVMPPISEGSLSDDALDCPEHTDPVVAVTGYHNRDEADICRHYKGPPFTTCFKGSRCTKKHILHHPDGWTLDQVPVSAKCESVPLPAPGTTVKVLVTGVCHFDRVYVQLVGDKPKEEIPEFGVVLPPRTLHALHRDMNSPGTIQAYQRLTISPAPGELVAALYTDGAWYRARVRTVTRADQCVEVLYVDYGTITWVKEDQIRVLEARFLALPLQGVQCALAGVLPRGDVQQWTRARRALADLVLDREVLAHVIAREFDEIIVELLVYEDEEQSRLVNVAEQLADAGLVELCEYSVADDAGVIQKLVVP